MKIFAVRLNPDPREGLAYSNYPTLEEYQSVHGDSPMDGFHEAANFLPKAGVVKGYLPPRHLTSIRSGESFCLITISAKTAKKSGDMIFGIQACCRYLGEQKREGLDDSLSALGLTFHYSCPSTYSMLLDSPLANARDLILEKNRYWGQGPVYEIRKQTTLSKVIVEAIQNGCIKKSNTKLKNILGWLNNKNLPPTTIDIYQANFNKEVQNLIEADINEPPRGNKYPQLREIISYQYTRDPKVAAYALLVAKGICQDCEKEAPFISKKYNRPFLEVHHIKPVSDGGSDTIDNVIALCPNCHRKRHYG